MPRPKWSTPTEVASELKLLSPGSQVGVLDLLGSMCPITQAHVECRKLAKQLLTGEVMVQGQENFQPLPLVLASINVNGDAHVTAKLKSRGEASLSAKDRQHLCALATADMPWIRADGRRLDVWLAELSREFPGLKFVKWVVNGADDVVKYRKWTSCGPGNRLITIGRPGDTEKVRKAVQAHAACACRSSGT